VFFALIAKGRCSQRRFQEAWLGFFGLGSGIKRPSKEFGVVIYLAGFALA
jgi:hypothetical protein